METAEYWERKFKAEKTTWSFTPSDSAILTKDFFHETQVKDILIFYPGFKTFRDVWYGQSFKYLHPLFRGILCFLCFGGKIFLFMPQLMLLRTHGTLTFQVKDSCVFSLFRIYAT
jgi:hypothetical protein